MRRVSLLLLWSTTNNNNDTAARPRRINRRPIACFLVSTAAACPPSSWSGHKIALLGIILYFYFIDPLTLVCVWVWDFGIVTAFLSSVQSSRWPLLEQQQQDKKPISLTPFMCKFVADLETSFMAFLPMLFVVISCVTMDDAHIIPSSTCAYCVPSRPDLIYCCSCYRRASQPPGLVNWQTHEWVVAGKGAKRSLVVCCGVSPWMWRTEPTATFVQRLLYSAIVPIVLAICRCTQWVNKGLVLS